MTTLERAPAAAAIEPSDPVPSVVVRTRMLAACIGLTLLAFMQEPGKLVADTKFDLLLDPVGLMTRALHIWEPLGYAGQVQNQGYGYLFPMGPFFATGEWVGLPDWVVQRAWWALILCAAFVGLERLAAAMGIGTPWPRLIAALAFALSPRMMTTLGPISSEALPLALAPWAVLPLVRGSRSGSPLRAGLLAGGVLIFAGGVNATANVALLILPAIYLITRSRGIRRRRLTLGWIVGVALATLWWVVPLLVLSRVSPPFLDFIENANVTTGMNSLAQVVRGGDHWLAYVASDGVPVWRAGWMIVGLPIVIAYTAIVAGAGLIGLSLKGIPDRVFLVAGALAGIFLLTFGYAGALGTPWAGFEQTLLDGALAPFRNVHKFDPILRVVLSLGVAYLLTRIAASTRGRPGWGAVAPAVSALVALGAVGSAFPALIGQLAPGGSVASVPAYWDEASKFLAGQGGTGRSLVIPGSSFARYIWGTPRDEPLQSWGRSAWTLRDAIPLAPGGTVRWLDAIRSYVSSAREMPGLADSLAAAGVEYLVIRNDLDTSLGKVPLPSIVHEALRGAPGLAFAADFGPLVGGPVDQGAVVDRGLSVPYRAIEVYRVIPFTGLVSLSPTADVPIVVGGPDNVVDVRNQGILGAGPTVLDGEGAPGDWGPLVQTDGVAVRELNPGILEGNTSARLTTDDTLVLDRRARDFSAFADARADAPAAWLDGAVITASSQASDADTPGGARHSAQAASALDADLSTAWVSASLDGAPGQWWDVRWSAPVAATSATVLLDVSRGDSRVTGLEITTDGGTQEVQVDEAGKASFVVPGGQTAHLRIEATSVSGRSQASVFAIRDIIGFPPVRKSATSPVPSRTPDVTALTAGADGVPDCVHVPSRVVCSTLLARAGEEDAAIDRVVDVGAGGPQSLSLRAVARPGAWLDDALSKADAASGHSMRAQASSSLVSDPEGGPRASIDGSLDTSWLAGEDDKAPRLSVAWDEPRAISGIRVREGLDAPMSRPLSAKVEFPDGTVKIGRFNAGGILSWKPAITTSSIQITFPDVQKVYSVDPSVGGGQVLPLGVSELRVLGAGDLQPTATSAHAITWPCGEGPVVRMGSTLVEFTARTLVRDLEQGLEVPWRSCAAGAAGSTAGQADIPGGIQRVIATGGDRWSVRSLVVGDAADLPKGAQEMTAVTPLVWDPTYREMDVSAAQVPRLLVIRENASPGWVASIGDQSLKAVRVDGWAQGWVVPAGAEGAITVRFPWDSWYRAGLIGGALALLVLILAIVIAGRRDRWGDAAPATSERVLAGPVAMTGATVAFGLMAGVPGVVAAVAAIAVTAAWPGRWGLRIRVGTVLLAWSAASVLLVFGPWGTSHYAGDSRWVGILSLIALAAATMTWRVEPIDSWVSRADETSRTTPQG